ncbi:hypothetical protein ONZ45_g9524 [Pleurotus djamor]|nr:hypothetical protein ONZ45_g9524 [Pleurotus djamor]
MASMSNWRVGCSAAFATKSQRPFAASKDYLRPPTTFPTVTMKFAAIFVFAVAAFATGSEAVSCKVQSDDKKGYMCVTGKCPKGWSSVFWDSGCSGKQRCCI